MKKKTMLSRLAVKGAGLATAVLLASAAPVSATTTLATITTSTGNAYGIRASGAVVGLTVAFVPVNVPETPLVATTNSPVTATRTVASVVSPTLCAVFTPTCTVNAHALRVTTRNALASGLAPASSASSADTADVSLLYDLLKFKVIHAECRADRNGATMSASLVASPTTSTPLPVPVDVPIPDTSSGIAPNTTVPIGVGDTQVGTLILNEQIDNSTSTRHSVEVNAIHLKLNPGSVLTGSGLDVVVSHAACSVAV